MYNKTGASCDLTFAGKDGSLQMEQLNKSIQLYFWFALGLSIGLPLGILGIVFGAVYWILPLLIAGILLTVAGFYAMPLLWIKYGERRQDRTLLRMIERDYLYTVSDLSAQTGFSEADVRAKIKRMILSHALVGYLFRDDVLEVNTNQKQTRIPKRTRKCDSCGATMYFDGLQYRCDYCQQTADAD